MTKRICLGIETTGSHLGLVLHDLSKASVPCLARHFEPAEGKQAELLFPTLQKLMSSARIRREDLAGIVVNHGPGSFTGVRIGVSSARALSQTLQVPLIGVSGLEAMAAAVDVPDKSAVIIARLPAVAGEAYHAAFFRDRTLSRPAWTREDEFQRLVRRFQKRPIAIVMVERANGDSFSAPEGAAVIHIPAPDPSSLVELAVRRHGRRWSRTNFTPEKVAPVYLQPSWAERSVLKRKA